MPKTERLQLEYPAVGLIPDVPGDIFKLAVSIEAVLWPSASAIAARSTNQVIPNNTFTPIVWLAAESESSTAISVSATSNGRITLNSGAPSGRYLLTTSATVANSSGGSTRATRVMKNGINLAGASTGVGQQTLTISTEVTMIAGDYLTLEMFQNSGGDLNASPNVNYPARVTLRYVGQ